MIQSYLHGIDTVAAVTNVRKRVSIIGTKLLPTEIAPVTVALPASEPSDGAGTLVGLAAGGILWSEHRVLGMLLGASLGRNTPAFLQSDTRRAAACNITQTTGGVVGSLLLGRIGTVSKIAGFIAGWVVAGALLYYGDIRESPTAGVV